MNSRVIQATRAVLGEVVTLAEALLLSLFFLLLVVLVLSVRNQDVLGFESFARLLNTNGFYYAGGFILGQLVFLCVALYRRKKQRAEIDEWKGAGGNLSAGGNFLLGVGTGLGLLLLVVLYGCALRLMGTGINLLDAGQEAAQSVGLLEKLAVLFALGFVAPVCEELFFREIIFGNILRAGFPFAGLVFSALVFAAVHFNPVFLPGLFMYGAAFAVLYQATRSLVAPVAAHLTINTIDTSIILFS